MCAYNAINGEPACANAFLLQDQLRGAWDFQGYVVSDCDAVRQHLQRTPLTQTQPQASAISLSAAWTTSASTFAKVNDDHDYKPYVDAVKQGFLPESTIDTALIRLFTARMRLGMFDPPDDGAVRARSTRSNSTVPLIAQLARQHRERIDGAAEERRRPAAEVCQAQIAVVGPLADQTAGSARQLQRHSSHTVSVLEGMKAEFPDAKITYVPGTQFLLESGQTPCPHLSDHAGWKAWPQSRIRSRPSFDAKPTPLTSRVESSCEL